MHILQDAPRDHRRTPWLTEVSSQSITAFLSRLDYRFVSGFVSRLAPRFVPKSRWTKPSERAWGVPGAAWERLVESLGTEIDWSWGETGDFESLGWSWAKFESTLERFWAESAPMMLQFWCEFGQCWVWKPDFLENVPTTAATAVFLWLRCGLRCGLHARKTTWFAKCSPNCSHNAFVWSGVRLMLGLETRFFGKCSPHCSHSCFLKWRNRTGCWSRWVDVGRCG